MLTDSILNHIKETLSKGIGLKGKRFSVVIDDVKEKKPWLFSLPESDLGTYLPDFNAHRLRIIRTVRTFEQLLQEQCNEPHIRSSVYCFEDDTPLVNPPRDVESNPDVVWAVLRKDAGCHYVNEVATYHAVDDRPAPSSEHLIRVFHVTVPEGRILPCSEKTGGLGGGLWEITVECHKRPNKEAFGCAILAVRKLASSSLVEAQRMLATLSPSLERRPPSMQY